MGDLTNVVLLLRVIAELAALIERAIGSGKDATDEEIAAAFGRAELADMKWAKAFERKANAQATLAGGNGDEEETDVD
jgi:hypothetical protein